MRGNLGGNVVGEVNNNPRISVFGWHCEKYRLHWVVFVPANCGDERGTLYCAACLG